MQTKPSARARTHPWIYALGMLGITIPGYMLTTYQTFFYNDVLKLSLEMISRGLVFFTIWDVLNDPIMGILSDRTRSRHGRRRPWILVAAPLYMVFFVLFFSPTVFGAEQNVGVLAFYFAGFLMLTETMSTITNLNYHALFPELFRTQGERRKANALRQALQLVGLIAGVALPPMIIAKIGYQATAILLSGVGMALLVISALFSKEDPDYQTPEKPKVWATLLDVLSNRNFWPIGFTRMFYAATTNVLMAAMPFFIRYALRLPDGDATFLTASVFVVAIPFMALWSLIIKHIGALKAWRFSLAFMGCALVPMFFMQSLVTAMIAGAFIGIGIAGVTANLDLVTARILDEDAAKSNLRREGTYNSVFGLLGRCANFLTALVFLLITRMFGFVDGDTPGLRADEAVRWMIAIFPALLMLVSFIASLFVKLSGFEKESSEK